MAVTFDPVKRAIALRDRGLDFAIAAEVFVDPHVTLEDDRFDYGETRWITAGLLRNRMVVLVWTSRGDDRHIISMRHCHAKEEARWRLEIEQHISSGIRQDVDRRS
jgi:uncharacterized DUF497 family protein